MPRRKPLGCPAQSEAKRRTLIMELHGAFGLGRRGILSVTAMLSHRAAWWVSAIKSQFA